LPSFRRLETTTLHPGLRRGGVAPLGQVGCGTGVPPVVVMFPFTAETAVPRWYPQTGKVLSISPPSGLQT